MRLDLRCNTECSSYYTGAYDTTLITSARRFLRHLEAWTVLDVGANVGFWTTGLATLACKAECLLHAFEPVESNYRRLLENVNLNCLQGVVRCHNFGLSDAEARVDISLREDFQSGSKTGNASIVIDDSDRSFLCREVRLVALDSVVAELGINRLDFVKLDIEGHEDRFLVGAAGTIATLRPVVLMETNDAYYVRRGVDLTLILSSWMKSTDYVSAIMRRKTWKLAVLNDRKPGLDNVLLLPLESAADIIKTMNSI